MSCPHLVRKEAGDYSSVEPKPHAYYSEDSRPNIGVYLW